MKAVLSLTLLVCAAPALAAPAPLSAAEREKKELRFVELLRQGLHAPPPDQKAGEAMANELRSLLFALAGVDPAAPPSQATAQKIVATQADVLARRDPALRDEILRETKRYICRMKQSEAKSGLKMLFVMERSWQIEHDAFTGKLADLDASDLAAKWYGYTLLAADAKHFRARATGKAEMAGDVWEIDEAGEPKNTANLCPPAPKPAGP